MQSLSVIVSKQTIGTKAVGPGLAPTTSFDLQTTPVVNVAAGTLPLEPFIVALKRFPSIEVQYLLMSPMVFAGLKDFENKYVKITMNQSTNSYVYRIRVKDSHFDRLGLP